MKILYCTDSTIPSDLANAHQVAQMCDAFVRLGHTVTIVAPARFDVQPVSLREKYAISPAVQLVYLPYLFDAPVVRRWRLLRLIANVLYRYRLRRWLREQSFDLLYTRVLFFLYSLLRTRRPVVLELHALPLVFKKWFVRSCNACVRVVCLTSGMHEVLREWGISPQRLLVEGDAVNLERFAHLPAQQAARMLFGLPQDARVIGYVGRLRTQGMEKGVRELVHALSMLKQQGVACCGFIVGGPAEWSAHYRALADTLGLSTTDICFHDQIPFSNVPAALAACDVCVYPAPLSVHAYFRRDTSPLKLFEYMAARKPIVAAALPPLRDIVDESMVAFCAPGDPEDLARTIEMLLREPERAACLADAAWQRVQEHTWEQRAERILQAVTSL